MKVEPFRPEHAELIAVPENLHEGAATVIEDGTILGVIGAHQDGEFVEVWAIFSDEAKARPVTLCRAARKFVRMMQTEHGNIMVRTGPHNRWAEYLGFVFDNDIGKLRV